MIEGGATVIKGLLSSDGVVDELVVTVSPVLIGSTGLSIMSVSAAAIILIHAKA